jgi:hypothetical protein
MSDSHIIFEQIVLFFTLLKGNFIENYILASSIILNWSGSFRPSRLYCFSTVTQGFYSSIIFKGIEIILDILNSQR